MTVEITLHKVILLSDHLLCQERCDIIERMGEKIWRFWPEIFLGLTILLIALANYSPGTFLSGWDNLHPEFNFSLNIKRSFQAVWQEYQGLGLLGGMGHASDLPRQIILFLLSLLFPPSFLRYLFVFLCLFFGPLGIYLLGKNLLALGKLPAFLAGLFYLLNLGTIQAFYFPFTPFVIHFASLPYLFLFFGKFLQEGKKKNLIAFFLFSILALPQGYVPTIFIVYLSALFLFSLPYLYQKKSFFYHRTALLFAVVFLVNAFWLLPQLFFTFKNSSIVLSAKINKMATGENIWKNQKFGNLKDVVLLRGFWLENTDIDPAGETKYVMPQWRKHLQNPLVQIGGVLIFLFVLFGLFSSWRENLGFLLTFSLSFSMLANNTPPFSLVFTLLCRYLPLFAQIFRMPFTKFSLLFAFSSAIFFGLSLEKLKKITSSLVFLGFSEGIILLFLLLTLPLWEGNLFYPRLKVQIPREYFELFAWLKDREKESRIANLPQPHFWGWSWYRWGYTGSGFLWYGIEQPILDRAFDVWSATDEQYFWEIQQAIYSENLPLLEKVIDKYQIAYLLLDKNIITYGNQKALNLENLSRMLNKSKKISLVKKFGSIEVYQTKMEPKFTKFITFLSRLPEVGPRFAWADTDTAFEELGFYLSPLSQPAVNVNFFYPFRSLSTNNEPAENLFWEADKITTILPPLGEVGVRLPDFSKEEEILPVELHVGDNRFQIKPLLPKIRVGEEEIKLEGKTIEIPLPQKEVIWTLNGEKFDRLGYLFTKRGNEVRFFSKTAKIIYSPGPGSFQKEPLNCAEEKEGAEVKMERGEEIVLKGKNSAPCAHLQYPLDFIRPGDLVQVRLKYRSKSDEIPIYCLYSDERRNCLNIKEKGKFGHSPTWQEFEDWVVAFISREDKLSFRLILDAYTAEKEKEIAYKDILIEVYPLIGGEGVEIPEFGEKTQKIDIGEEKKMTVEFPPLSGLFSPAEVIGAKTFTWQKENCNPFSPGEIRKKEDKGVLLLGAKEANSCASFNFNFLPHHLSYLLVLKTENLRGLPLRLYVSNQTNQHALTSLYLAGGKEFLLLPPQEKGGRGYTIVLENISFNQRWTENKIISLKIKPFFYSFLKKIRLEGETDGRGNNLPLEVEKRAIFWYRVRIPSNQKGVLILSQSFDEGWIAFLGRQRLKHSLVNNWANGWLVPKKEGKQLIVHIFYLPQILEFLGFALLLGGGIILTVKPRS